MAESKSGAENAQNDLVTSVTMDSKEAMKDYQGHNDTTLNLNERCSFSLATDGTIWLSKIFSAVN